MAVLMLLEWEGTTTDQYDAVNRAMGVTGDGDAPDGLVSHAIAVTDDGSLMVADVWESPEALQTFVEQRLSGALREVGIPEAHPRVLPVHAHLRGRGEPGVMVVIEIPDASSDVYDEMAAEMPAHAGDGSNHPAHTHAIAVDGDSLVVVDVWGSAKEFQKFAQEQIGPAGQRHGMGEMDVAIHPIHTTIRGATAAKS